MATLTLTTTSSLNGGSIDIVVHEDTNQDGTSDNSDTVSLTGGTDEENTTADVFTGGSGNDYWVDFQPSVTNPTDDAPTLDKAVLEV